MESNIQSQADGDQAVELPYQITWGVTYTLVYGPKGEYHTRAMCEARASSAAEAIEAVRLASAANGHSVRDVTVEALSPIPRCFTDGEGAESAEEMDAPHSLVPWTTSKPVKMQCWDCGSQFTRRPSEPRAKGLCVHCYVASKL